MTTPNSNLAVGGLYLALPTYDGWRVNMQSVLHAAANPAPFRGVRVDDAGTSLLALNFNEMWARALNERSAGITHFAMLHADVVPHSRMWVGDMRRIMDSTGASVLSVVLPIKDQRGLTTTGLYGETDHTLRKRFTLKEVYQQPPTFTHERLLVNTGLMMIDFRASWVEQFCFKMNDEIRRKPSGEYYATAESEDWYFSRRARELGATIVATREIAASHLGSAFYDNTSPWGEAYDSGGNLTVHNQPPIIQEGIST